MKHYLTVIKGIFSISLSRLFAYRLDTLISSLFNSGSWAAFNVLSMYLVSSRASTIFGWSTGELILISCLYNIMIGIFSLLFSRAINEFSELIDEGQMDFFLLKPLDSQFLVTMKGFHIPSLIRLIIGVFLGSFIINHYQLSIEPINILLFGISIIPAVLLLYSCIFFISIMIIWSPRTDNVTQLFYTLRSLGRYPRESFEHASELIFVFAAPFVIVLATPARILLGTSSIYHWVELLSITTIAMIVTRLFWKFALRHYTSASS